MDYQLLHVENTSRCNAWCPSCSRNNKGYGLSDELVVQDLDPQKLDQVLDQYKTITTVQLCGNLGDPIAAKNIDTHLEIILKHQTPIIQIHTNGSLRTTDWWENLAEYTNHFDKKSKVVFALDGIGDVHEYYRQGTNYEKIIENATAFINAGGTAVWQFIPFKHNEHQIKDCIKLSKKLGFKKFDFVKNARYYSKAYHYRTGELLDIKKPGNDDIVNMNTNLQTKKIVQKKNCMHLETPSIYLSAKGLVTPCCFLYNTTLDSVNIKQDLDTYNYKAKCLASCGTRQ